MSQAAMKDACHPWMTPLARVGRPSVGNLMSLCEENYCALIRLIPGLRHLRGEQCCIPADDQDLHLEILEQAPFTTLLRLTYYFPHDDGLLHRQKQPDPDVLLRAYHDARQAEVLDLRQTSLPIYSDYRHPALETKWRVNLFLSKWLSYCLARGYRFPAKIDSGAVANRVLAASTS